MTNSPSPGLDLRGHSTARPRSGSRSTSYVADPRRWTPSPRPRPTTCPAPPATGERNDGAMRHHGGLSTPALAASPEGGDLGFRHPAADCARPGNRLPFLAGLSGVSVDRALGRGHQAQAMRGASRRTAGCGRPLSIRKPLVAQSRLASPSSELSRPSAAELVATPRQARTRTPEPIEGSPGRAFGR
jgi:hypothetical protein